MPSLRGLHVINSMFRNERKGGKTVTQVSNVDRIYIDLLYQDRLWRRGSGEMLLIDAMKMEYLINVKKYLEDSARGYYDVVNQTFPASQNSRNLRGTPPGTNSAATSWMRRTPLYRAICAEIDKRYKKQADEYSAARATRNLDCEGIPRILPTTKGIGIKNHTEGFGHWYAYDQIEQAYAEILRALGKRNDITVKWDEVTTFPYRNTYIK